MPVKSPTSTPAMSIRLLVAFLSFCLMLSMGSVTASSAAAVGQSVSVAGVKFKARTVTAYIPTRAVYRAASEKTIVVASRKVRVRAKSTNGRVVLVQLNGVWTPVAYKLTKNGSLKFDEAVRIRWGLFENDPLGGARPQYIGTKAPEPVIPPEGDEPPPMSPLDGEEKSVLDGINAGRGAAGMPGVIPCKNLNAAADQWAAMLVDAGQVGSVIDMPNGTRQSLNTFVRETTRYSAAPGTRGSFWTKPTSSPAAWAQGHRLDGWYSGFRHIGIGHAPAAGGDDMWVIIFYESGSCF